MEKIIQINYMRCLKAFIRKLPLLIIITMAVGIFSAIVGYFVLEHENLYTARASAYTVTDELANSAKGVQYAEIAKSLSVAQLALDELGDIGLSKYDIYDMIKVEFDNESAYVNSSSIINIYVSAKDPLLTIQIANAVTKAFVQEVTAIIDESSQIAVLDLATQVDISYNAQDGLAMFILVGCIIGFFITAFITLLPEILSLKIISLSDVSLYGKLEVLGVIPDTTKI